MGADGHVTFWDWDKIRKNFPKRNEDFLQSCFGMAYLYPNPFNTTPQKILVTYWDSDGLSHLTPPIFLFNQKLCVDLSRPRFFSYLERARAGEQDVVTWAVKNALIACFEVWT